MIISSVPYTITSRTVIGTDETNPTITTNGVTDEGRIYDGAFSPSQNGPASTYFFTASRPFDATSGFEGVFQLPREHVIATFKFLALRLMVSIDSRIQVSSADPAPVGTPHPTPPRRRSTEGGDITVRSGRVGTPPGSVGVPRAVAVNISNSSQLLALLDAAPEQRAWRQNHDPRHRREYRHQRHGRLAATKARSTSAMTPIAAA